MTPTDPTLDRLRTVYAESRPTDGVELRDMLQRVRTSHGARQRRRDMGVAVGSAAMLTIAAIVAVPWTLLDSDDGHSPVAEPTTPGVSPTAQTQPGDVRVADALDRLYPIIDATPGRGYYMVSVHDDTVTIWSDELGTLQPIAAQVESASGTSVLVRPLAEAPPASTEDEANLSKAADAMKTLLSQHPAAGYSALRIQTPFNQILLWRTNPLSAVDSQLQSIANDLHVHLELRTATYTKRHLDDLISGLRARNDEFQELGFNITGGRTTPTGVIVTVDGDVDAAHVLLDETGVIGLSGDNVISVAPPVVPR